MDSTKQNNGPEFRQVLNDHRVLRISDELKIKRMIKVGTWNVRSLFESGKLHNLTLEMSRMNVDVMGISEVRWPGSGVSTCGDYAMYYSGNEDRHHRNGVAVVVHNRIKKSLLNFVPISDRCLLIKLKGNPFNINLIQVYAPTLDKDEDEVEQFYDQVNDALKLTKNNEVTVVLGDFNAKVGDQPFEDIVGCFGLGDKNSRGDRLIQFCAENQLTACNTWFKQPLRRLYTWVSPQDTTDRIVRNQIDFILINDRFKRSVKCVKTYPGADLNSDHNPVIMRMQVKLKVCRKKSQVLKLNVRRMFEDEEARASLQEDINDDFQSVLVMDSNNELDIERSTTNVTSRIVSKAGDKLGYRKHNKNKCWMTDDILKLMEQRRLVKNNIEEYKALHRKIKQMIKVAKEEWMTKQCNEIEEYEKRFDYFNMHKKIRDITGFGKRKCHSNLVDSSGSIITEKENIMKEWSDYIRDLFNDSRLANDAIRDKSSGPPIIREELKYAIKQSKNNKAAGSDGIYNECIKLLNDENIDILLQLFNRIYETGQIPHEWLKSMFVALPKKPTAKSCNEHRLISLMSHLLKLFLKIIHKRIYSKIDTEISETQFGFRSGYGTREALVSMQLIVQKCQDQQKPVYLCLIDFEKAFDNVRHDKLIAILKEIGIDERDIAVIQNLYWNQTAQITIDGCESEQIEIKKGVRQGCILSPMLFNVYAEYIFRESVEDINKGIKINGKYINNIRYADDSALLAETFTDMQCLLQKVSDVSESYGLKINVNKTKWMYISKVQNVNLQLILNSKVIERVQHFTYLGSLISESWDPDTTIRARIEQARASFVKLRSLLCDKNLNFQIRWRTVICYVWSVLLYGVESWTLKKCSVKRLEAFEMWCMRRMQRISWTSRTTNDAVLGMCKTTRQLITCIKKRKTRYFGHVIRNKKYEVILLAIEGKIDGKRGIGRRKTSWLKDIRDWLGIRKSSDVIRLAEDRDRFREAIANLL